MPPVPLNPAPSSLGLASPALGPWFSSDVTLGTPDASGLFVSVALDGLDWLPPATGLLSLVVAANPRPRALAGLRQPSGDPAFTDGRLVALFRLLPEVEERLDTLSAAIPSVAGGTAASSVPTRARVRHLALELPESSPALSDLAGRLDPPFDSTLSTDADKAASVGLALDGTTLANAARPMFDLKRPGTFLGSRQKLLAFPTATTAKLWAFDAGGRALDPGAVAAWWAYLATTAFTNLWAGGVATADQRTTGAEAALTLVLANPHEGPADPVLLGRLNANAASNLTGTGLVRQRGTGTGAAAIGFTAAPGGTTPDDAPVPLAAILPNGRYGSGAALWPSGPVDPALARDFARVALVDVEAHLVGQRRVASSGADEATTRRAADQQRASTRITVNRTPAPVLLATTDAVADAALALYASTDPVRLVSSVADRDWGGLTAPVFPSASAPTALPTLTLVALTGGGTAAGGTVAGQSALLEGTFDPSLAGAWVRAWAQGFDPLAGRHVRLDGGAALIRSDGGVSVIVPLPDGDATPDAKLGLDLEVVTATDARLYPDQRFDRPLPVGGAALAASAITGQVVICETGQVVAAGSSLAATVPSGAHLFSREAGGPTLVDRASLPATALSADTLLPSAAAGDIVELTQPAFIGVPEGDAAADLGAAGVTVNRRTRSGLVRLVEAGAPLPTMERLEVLAARAGTTGAAAVVGSTPALGRYHELLPHQAGHPGAPAAVELHGSGATLGAAAAIEAAEIARDRTTPLTSDLAVAAATPFPAPTAPATPSAWAAVLRTVAGGVEAEPGLAEFLTGVAGYPFGGTLDSIRTWLAGLSITIPAGIDANAISVTRALDRRMLTAAWGAREAATALAAAFARAEDLVYVETPALDNLAFGQAGDEIDVLGALAARLDARPGLRVLICLPVRYPPGWPTPLGQVRDGLALATISALRAGGSGAAASAAAITRSERIAVFAPSAGMGRTVRLAATTVIVDDAWALTGTTHLWRRGLSFDSSVAVAAFDETLTAGRPADLRAFRRNLVAGRLGLSFSLVPTDPAELVDTVARLSSRGGGGRLATDAIVPPPTAITDADRDAWNRDGSAQAGFNPVAWLINLAADVRSRLENEVPAGP